jgi:predicted enzyme related to lactoylglutathione lyase
MKMFRYAHTNIIANDSERLIEFYKSVLRCKSIGETRDIHGDWLDKMTGVAGSHIVGEHLCLPGYEEDRPTLEIFSYDKMETGSRQQINQCGIAHLAFEVDDVEETLERILSAGGGQIGEVVKAEYEDGRKATFVYATDIEGNILELQSWQQAKPEVH